MKVLAISLFTISLVLPLQAAHSDPIAKKNAVKKPPLVDPKSKDCDMQLKFKDALPFGDSQHAFIVIQTPEKQFFEVRGGPSKALASESFALGDVFSCKSVHKLGIVAPYVGPHGILGKDGAGKNIYSPDGNAKPNASKRLDKGKQETVCALANCVMKVTHSLGKSCRKYIAGVKWLRNSNTIISTALKECGAPTSLPEKIKAPGWDENWSRTN